MKETKMIQIDKKYDKEEVYQAVLTYMSPSSDRERVKTEVGNNSYIVRTEWLSSPKKGSWVTARIVKLTFTGEACYVDIDVDIQSGVREKPGTMATIGATAIASMVCPPAFFVGMGGAAAAYAVEGKKGFNKFKQDIYKLIEGYLCSETKQSINAIEQKCECGAVLPEGAKFCPVCGKKVGT